MAATAQLPPWARWTASAPYSVGVEEEVMLLRPDDWSLAQEADAVYGALPAELQARVGTETHNAALELAGSPHGTVEAAAAELADLRADLSGTLAGRGLRAAAAGTHPWASWQDVQISAGQRYAEVYRTMRELARREPTFALHVHVGVPDPEQAVTLLRALRGYLPLLLALSANSPFWRGQDSGMASIRTSIFRMFPRVGIPRPFRSYDDYVGGVDAMLRCGAIPEPTFLWWDLRLQPRLGTVEVRIMDAQTASWQTAALAALVQSIARFELEEGPLDLADPPPEILDENVFLAARDGLEAELLDPLAGRAVPVGSLIEALLNRLAPHARELGCAGELTAVREIARRGGGAHRQRRIVEQRGRDALLPALADTFTAG